MSSPVQIGTEVLFASCSYWPVYCQGMTSSSQAGSYFSIRRASRMPSFSEMWPRWSIAIGISGADDRAHLGEVLLQKVEALLGEVEAGEGMADIVHVVAGVLPPALLERLHVAIRSYRVL